MKQFSDKEIAGIIFEGFKKDFWGMCDPNAFEVLSKGKKLGEEEGYDDMKGLDLVVKRIREKINETISTYE